MRSATRILCGVGAAMLLSGVSMAQEAGKARLTVSATTFKTTIPGLDTSKLPPEAAAALSGLGAQRMLQVTLRKPGAPPASPTAALDIPTGLQLGPTLVLDVAKPADGKVEDFSLPFKSGAQGMEIWQYWGCSATVRPGQPKIIKTKGLSQEELRKLPQFSAQALRAAQNSTEAEWPHGKLKMPPQILPTAALPGKYALKSNFVPGLNFEVPANVSFLDGISLTVPQGGEEVKEKAIPISWKVVPNALGYFAMATGMRGNTLVMWNSAEHPDASAAAYDDDADVKALVQKGIYLAPDRTSCTIPAGIFKGCKSVSIQLTAAGPSFEQSGSTPSVRFTTRSTGMVLLGAGFGVPGDDE